ncbi:MAG: D-lysine 5,6-aminomutase subunit alpha, partial [Tenericutes bacterium]|nr:D-lysine 5,6-aminomutase subunit alpha [Mycoplasmatota bacterium]
MNKLNLDKIKIVSCRKHAEDIAVDVQNFINQHSTVSVERTVLRLLGVDGVDDFGVPIPNKIVDDVFINGDITLGISYYIASALKHFDNDLDNYINTYIREEKSICDYPLVRKDEVDQILKPHYDKFLVKIKDNKQERDNYLSKYKRDITDLYVIVATGNINEDVTQAVAAAKAGADIIAVIRSTGQSLLDYVPYGKTTEGFGGTFATQENFKIMRLALDKVSDEEGRYIKLVNYASGLCMPEIAAMGAIERLDMLLNDSMYGIIFRDINMQRT